MRLTLLTTCIVLLSISYSASAQSRVDKPLFDYSELKGLLLKHKSTVESMLSMKRFTLTTSKERPESTIYIFNKHSDTTPTQIFIRVRKRDGLTCEVAWREPSSTLAYITHDAVYDGFVPVNGNSKYQNRHQNMQLLIGYEFSEVGTILCTMQATE